MAPIEPPDAIDIPTVLNRLENLSADEYVLAFGPDGRQFFATPNGYSATYLPSRVLSDVSAGHVKKIIWASFGSELDSWFFSYEMSDGTRTCRTGPAIPKALHEFIEQIGESPQLMSSLHVQLGAHESFVVWSGTTWACLNIPKSLKSQLIKFSSMYKDFDTITKGSFSKHSHRNVAWHGSGSFYLKNGNQHVWKYCSEVMRQAWYGLWQNDSPSRSPNLSNLAYVAINSHAASGEAFAFLKQQQKGKEVPFTIRLDHDSTYSSLPSSRQPLPPDDRLEHVAQEPDQPSHYCWAISKKTGRPHPRDARELELRKNERVKILEDMGRDWFMAQDRKGLKGWVHRSWLSFGDEEPKADAKAIYSRFAQDMQKFLVPGQLRSFPCLKEYMNTCVKDECKLLKQDSLLGICLHDLQNLLMGSGEYSYGWLKEERNVWHPDKFARYCHADHKEGLKAHAEDMFVMYGILMDKCMTDDGNGE